MRGMKPDWIPELVASDVARVERHAAYVLCINGNRVEVLQNQNPKINVIAVVGSGSAFGQNFDRSVLLEVGIYRARPWQDTQGAPKRRPWCVMSPEQYLFVAPVLFRILQEETNRKGECLETGAEQSDLHFISSNPLLRARPPALLKDVCPERMQVQCGSSRLAVVGRSVLVSSPGQEDQGSWSVC